MAHALDDYQLNDAISGLSERLSHLAQRKKMWKRPPIPWKWLRKETYYCVLGLRGEILI